MSNSGTAEMTVASNQHTAISKRVKSICSRLTLNGNMITNSLSSVITVSTIRVRVNKNKTTIIRIVNTVYVATRPIEKLGFPRVLMNSTSICTGIICKLWISKHFFLVKTTKCKPNYNILVLYIALHNERRHYRCS